MIPGVILHLANDLPIMVDMEQLPLPSDRMIQCTNVRTVDGKRPSFVQDRNSTFVFPLEVIRLIEVPADGKSVGATVLELVPEAAPPTAAPDDEPDEGLLARIREI